MAKPGPRADTAPDDAPPGWAGVLFRRVPALDALRRYSLRTLGADLTAGLTVATVAVPQSMAYAMLAGLPPQYGLFTAIVMTAVGALFDSSRQLINGPTNVLSIALLSALAVVPEGDRVSATVLLSFLAGVVQLGIALLRLGDLTRYVSHSVIVGFTVGAGTLLVLDQAKNFLGLEARGGPDDHFLKRFWLSQTEGGGVQWPTVLIGVGTIAVVAGVRRFNGWRRSRGARFPIPQHLLAIVLMAALVWGFRLDERCDVKVVGAIPAALPHFALPQLQWDRVQLFAGDAFAVAVLGLLEAVAMAKFIAARSGQPLDVNQQCLSEGMANLAGSFFQCFPGSGSLTRSAVNQQAGAVTQWSGVFCATGVAATVLLFAPLAHFIPRAALAGLLILAAFRMVDWEQFLFHLRATRLDAGVVLATALAAVAVSVEFCVLIGVFVSFAVYVPRAAHVRLTPLKRTPDCDGVLLYDLEGELFFGAEPELKKHFIEIDHAACGEVRAVILALGRARNPDAAFLNLLRELQERLRGRDVALFLGAVDPELGKALARTGLTAQIGGDRIIGRRGDDDGAREALDAACRLLGDKGGSQRPGIEKS
ncbi:MAG TPA: SulP family inorganic anion transporter [Gemmataceae bacterium]|nr:SulP family inorganic anion transporter [Gemmataceae bacterium]